MIDISNLGLDPSFVGLALAPLVHQLVAYTQDIHGKTKPFVVYVCLALGFVGGLFYYFLGQETFSQFINAFASIGTLSLLGASFIWAMLHKPIGKVEDQTITQTDGFTKKY